MKDSFSEYQANIFRLFYIAFLMLMVGYALFLGYRIIAPFVANLIVAAVLAVIFQPVHKRLISLVKGRETLAAGLSTLLIVVSIVIPLLLFLGGLLSQGVDSVMAINDWLRKTDFDKLADQVHIQPYVEWLQQKLPFLDFDKLNLDDKILDVSKAAGQKILGWSTRFLADATGLIVSAFFVVALVFCFLRDGERIIHRLKYLVPLRSHQEDVIIESLERVMKSFLLGTLIIAGLQGVAGGIGMAFVGIPGLFWGTIMAFCSLIPVVGSSLIWLPAALYLGLNGQWKASIFIVCWGVLVIASIDTFLRPYFLRNASKVSTFYIFLAILGGMQAFGPIGILYGPLILSFLMVMLDIYSDEFHDSLARADRNERGSGDEIGGGEPEESDRP